VYFSGNFPSVFAFNKSIALEKTGPSSVSIVVSTNPKVLVGTNDARKFYSIIEPLDEELEEGTTYITGRSNEKMYSGSDGCDYFEITYKVLKKKGDRNTNYKFYTGIAAIFDAV